MGERWKLATRRRSRTERKKEKGEKATTSTSQRLEDSRTAAPSPILDNEVKAATANARSSLINASVEEIRKKSDRPPSISQFSLDRQHRRASLLSLVRPMVCPRPSVGLLAFDVES